LVPLLTAPSAIYPLSLHDALPILGEAGAEHALLRKTPTRGQHLEPERELHVAHLAQAHSNVGVLAVELDGAVVTTCLAPGVALRSEEHTSELQSRENLVCRLLLEK